MSDPEVVGRRLEPGSRGRRWRCGLLGLGLLAALGALLVLFLFRPAGQFFYPRCAFYATTGLFCPGCGGLRAVHAMLHGRLSEAVRSNALFVLGGPAAFGWWLWVRRSAGGAGVLTPRWVWLGMAVALVFTVVRNLPWAPAARWLVP